MAEGVPTLYRIRAVNRDPKFWFTDGFEKTAGQTSTLWHSLGNEAGTDNSLNYWNQVAGTWTLTTHVLTNTSAAANDLIVGGHADWTDMTFTVRFKWVTAGQIRPLIHCDGTAANFIFAAIDGANLRLFKMVGSVATQIATTPAALVNTTFYWGEVVALGTTYTVNLYADATGVKSTLLATTSGTIADAGVQSGVVGIQSATATAWVIAGNSPNMCTVTGTGPDGTQGQAWTPVVTTGEPAFAWSKTSPYAGTYTASIYNRNAAGNGAWQQTIRLFSGSSVTLSAQSKASAGTANVTAGGLTSGNAGTSYGALTAVGAITTNPTVSCNYTGAIGTAYFDALSILNPAYEISSDVPHLHTSSFTVQAMQPGNPSNSGIGAFTVNLHPPGSDGYAAAASIYNQLDYYLRLEFYESHGGDILANLVYAGIVTGIDNTDGETQSYTLTGVSDVGLLNLSKPFPGEVLSVAYGTGLTTNGSYRQARNYFGTNEPGWVDSFDTYTAGNYTSTGGIPFGGTSGSWSATTDEGFNVVSCSTGTDAVLLSKVGARAGDTLNSQFVQVTGRLAPSANNSQAGKMGVGLATDPNLTNFILVYAQAFLNAGTGLYDLTVVTYARGQSGGASTQTTFASAFTNVATPEGYVPLTLSIHFRGIPSSNDIFQVTGTVNGQDFIGGAQDLGSATVYPFLYFGAAQTGTATAYMRNLSQEYRFTDDTNTGVALVKSGMIGTPAHSIAKKSAASPTFLDVLSRAAALEGWMWRYTPQVYTVGSRTLGTVDLTADPGTDYGTTKRVVYEKGQNLVAFQLSGNADALAAGTVTSGTAGTDGGGLAHSRNIPAMLKYGSIVDQTLAVPVPTFSEQRAHSAQLMTNKVNVLANGSKSAVVLRDPAIVAIGPRELDKVMFHNPRQNVNYLVARILTYTVDEGQVRQSLVLDQFTVDSIAVSRNNPYMVPPPIMLKRLQQAIFQIANKFTSRS